MCMGTFLLRMRLRVKKKGCGCVCNHGTLMRHLRRHHGFFFEANEIALLSCSMISPPSLCGLIACSRSAHRMVACDLSAFPEAVNITEVATRTKLHLTTTATTIVKTVTDVFELTSWHAPVTIPLACFLFLTGQPRVRSCCSGPSPFDIILF